MSKEHEQNRMLLSLCIPTNGVVKWVIPVLKSIYSQGIADVCFEVIITDNGQENNLAVELESFLKKHSNLVYRKTSSNGFMNQVDAFDLAKGEFIKFINHRMALEVGSLEYLLDFVRDNRETKPVVYFLNQARSLNNSQEYNTFSDFMKGLAHWSSWSAGIGLWRSDYVKYKKEFKYDMTFPHISWLICDKERAYYIIDNHKLLNELPVLNTEKGKYNLFKAFAVDYNEIVENWFCSGDIKADAYEEIKKGLYDFLVEWYMKLIICDEDSSYVLDNYKENINKYFNVHDIHKTALKKYVRDAVWEELGEYEGKIQQLINKVRASRESNGVWIYGAGVRGGVLYKILTANKIKIQGFIDKRGEIIRNYCNLPVIVPENARGISSLILISLKNNGDIVRNELQKLGFSEEKTIVFF